MCRGKRNTGVTELHITVAWDRLWAPTWTRTLPSPTWPACCWRLLPQPISWANHLKNFSDQFTKSMEATDKWTVKLCMCVCNATFQQGTGRRITVTLLARLDLGKGVCAQLQAMVWWSSERSFRDLNSSETPGLCETKQSPDPDLLYCFKFIKVWQVNSVPTDLLSVVVIFLSGKNLVSYKTQKAISLTTARQCKRAKWEFQKEKIPFLFKRGLFETYLWQNHFIKSYQYPCFAVAKTVPNADLILRKCLISQSSLQVR